MQSFLDKAIIGDEPKSSQAKATQGKGKATAASKDLKNKNETTGYVYFLGT
ncbi:MAG: hypothetical protein H7326_03405, partial [Bdellovibrionaceae bacterium]|nr:hypothetical protein [Pseudobdellovibrionaceae bacterium]